MLMLQEEKENELIEDFLSSCYGESDDDYSVSGCSPSDTDMDIEMDMRRPERKRKRSKSTSSVSSKRSRSDSQHSNQGSDSGESTSTVGESNVEHTESVCNRAKKKKLSKNEIGLKLFFSF